MSIHAADALMEIFGFKRVEEKEMDKVYETRRALFEAWAKNSCGRVWRENSPDCDSDGYQDSHTNLCWAAFNAALDAVEIELPEPHFEFDGDTCGELFDSQVRAAIESTGLGLRIK